MIQAKSGKRPLKENGNCSIRSNSLAPVGQKFIPFEEATVGSKVKRMLAGTIPVYLLVSAITDKTIECGDWTFDRKTGLEIDDTIPVLVSF